MILQHPGVLLKSNPATFDDYDVNTMEELLERFRERFNARVEDDEKFREHIEGKEKSVQIDITDGTGFFMELKDCILGSVKKGILEKPDIKFSANLEIFTGVMKGEIKLLRAYAKRQFKVKASFKDIGLLKKLVPKKDSTKSEKADDS